MGKFIVLNHKMNLEYDEVVPYIQGLNQIDTKHNLIVCPSSLYLGDFVNHCTWGVGIQNVHEKVDGNYTGEISTLQVKSMGIEYALVGHYERKKYFGESMAQVRQKLEACLDANISPILCFGETGKDEEILKDLEILLEGIQNIDFIVFAYEPLMVSEKESVHDIQEKVDRVYDYLHEKYGSTPNVIYGGGVAQKDIHELLKDEKLNGLLLGKISANIDKVKKIVASL